MIETSETVETPMEAKLIVSAYTCITPALFECHQRALTDAKQVIAVCFSDRWLAHLGQPSAFPQEERACLAEALAGVHQVHIVDGNADIDALKQHYATRDLAFIDTLEPDSLTASRRLQECASMSSHQPGYYPPSQA